MTERPTVSFVGRHGLRFSPLRLVLLNSNGNGVQSFTCPYSSSNFIDVRFKFPLTRQQWVAKGVDKIRISWRVSVYLFMDESWTFIDRDRTKVICFILVPV